MSVTVTPVSTLGSLVKITYSELYNLTNVNSSLVGGNSTGNVTSLPQKAYFFKTGQLIFIVGLLLTIVIGNFFVLVAVVKSRRRSRMTFFIMHLAISDLLVGLFSIIPDMFLYSFEVWLGGEVLCKIVKFLQCFAIYGSTYVLVALSIDRLDAIARPLGFSNSGFRCKVLVSGAWGTAALFSIPTMVLFKHDFCAMYLNEVGWQLYLTLIAFAVFFIPAIIIIACYATIICIIWRHNKVLQSTDTSREEGKQLYPSKNGFKTNVSPRPFRYRGRETSMSSRGIIPQAKIRTIKMTVVIVFVFLCCWSPYFVFNLLVVYKQVDFSSKTTQAVSTFVQSLAPLNSAANPIIYGIFSTRVCHQLRRYKVISSMLNKLNCCKEEKRESRQMSLQTSEFTNVHDGTTHTTYRHHLTTPDRSSDIIKISHSTEMCDLIASCGRKS